jgi:hypothetical protein
MTRRTIEKHERGSEISGPYKRSIRQAIEDAGAVLSDDGFVTVTREAKASVGNQK